MQFEPQAKHYQAHYPHSEHVIVLRDRTPVGRLRVERAPAQR
jgi:hypothetical protein